MEKANNHEMGNSLFNILYKTTTLSNICGTFCTKIRRTIMETKNSFISSASVKVQGRTAYYKMLEAVRQGELIQVCRGVYANIDQLSA